jgi:hypothetical protein
MYNCNTKNRSEKMGRVKVKQDSLTKKKTKDNSLFNFYEGKVLVATINVFPSGNIFVWQANKIFARKEQEINVE